MDYKSDETYAMLYLPLGQEPDKRSTTLRLERKHWTKGKTLSEQFGKRCWVYLEKYLPILEKYYKFDKTLDVPGSVKLTAKALFLCFDYDFFRHQMHFSFIFLLFLDAPVIFCFFLLFPLVFSSFPFFLVSSGAVSCSPLQVRLQTTCERRLN